MELSLGVNIESSYFEEQKVEQGRNNGTKRGNAGGTKALVGIWMSDAWTRQVQSDKPMHTFPQLLPDLLKGRRHAFGNRVTMDREPAVLLRLSTLVSETQKVESLGSALAVSLAPFDGVLPKLDQSSLVLVQL